MKNAVNSDRGGLVDEEALAERFAGRIRTCCGRS